MNVETIFKRLVGGSVTVYMVWVCLLWVEGWFVSEDVADTLLWNGVGAILTLPSGIMWLTALLYIPVAIGLCSYSPAARWLFLALTFFHYVWVVFSRVTVYTPAGATLGNIVTLADGAILTLAYLTPLKGKFEEAVLAEPGAAPNGDPAASVENPNAPDGCHR